jgi:glycosyltransferase involved in cell wall biosynthesis
MNRPKLSALVVAHNEEARLAGCLETLGFADEIVVVLDKCTDGSREIARRYTEHLLEGDWEIEGERRNAGIEHCRGEWIFELDADERVPQALAREIGEVVRESTCDWHLIPVANHIGKHRVTHGWGGSIAKGSYAGLFRKGAKTWGRQRVHPKLTFHGRKGPALSVPIDHFGFRDISDMIRRVDSYSTARAADLRKQGEIGSFSANLRRIFSRFFKCYVLRKGYREGGYGFLIALLAGLYPILSYLKARLEAD